MTEGSSPAPHVLRVVSNGLEHRVLCWGEHHASTVVLLHGFADAAGTWDDVAPLLATGARVLAPDLRGFGRGARAPAGSYYHFPDYIADVAGLVDELVPDEPFRLIGHSMGGVVATLYTGAFPERVASLANLEGLGPPDSGFDAGPDRMRRWIDGVRALDDRGPMTRADARRRLGMAHPLVPADVLDRKLPHLVDAVDDGVRWLTDPRHRTTAPVPFFTELFCAYARRITCPTLFVSGGPTGFHPADEETRLAAFASLRRVTLDGAGHMLHWTRPAELVASIQAA